MTKDLEWRDILQTADATACPKCQSQAFVVAVEYERNREQMRPRPAAGRAGFCFECGYEGASGADSGVR